MSDLDNSDVPDMERLWQEYVRTAPRREAEHRPWVQKQVCEAIRRARRGHNYMTGVNLWVLVPKCMSCVHDEVRATDALGLPSVYGTDFAKDYAALGFSRRQIQEIKTALQNGSWRPRCYYWCGSAIDVMGEGFSVRRTDILEYFGIGTHDGRTPPKWMKGAVLRGFGGKCAGCKKRLSPDQVAFDHIVAASKGGPTEITNLQVLCQPCNVAKGHKDVEVVDVELTFPLRPPPSGDYETLIW